MLALFYFQFVVLQVSLVPKGYRQNFTFTGAKGLDEETRITLPSFLFQTKGKYVNKQFPCRKTNSSSLCKCILACAMLFLLQKIKKMDDVQSFQISLRSSTFRIYILFMIIDLIDALSRSTLSLLSVILIPTLAISLAMRVLYLFLLVKFFAFIFRDYCV